MSNQPQQTIDDLVTLVGSYDPEANMDRIRQAYAFAAEAHKDQKRASGKPYIVHPLATAINLAHMRLPEDMVIAGILHDVPEDTSRTLEDINKEFGPEVERLVSGITKLGKIKYRGVERYIENLRKMFLAMAEDVRVVIIKFADRLHNLETLDSIPPKKQYRIALESLEIYAPIANRLGMGDMKGRLEDAAFKYVLPKEYEWTKHIADTVIQKQDSYIENIIQILKDDLRQAHLPIIEVHGRTKHLYSLYQKLIKNERNIARIYDIIALRVIVPTIGDCYAALGIIHGRWTPLKGRIKDYIAQPKPNGYRSLHTTVFCEDGEIVEFQIRTKEMHESAEFGIAAHWAYDEDKAKQAQKGEEKLDWVSQLAEIQRDISDKRQYLKSLEEIKIDLFRDRIFVFTPKGDVIDLPDESTPVDLAYAIHTEIGNTCVASKINDELAPLSTPLRSGDMVEIVTDKSRKGPNPDWIEFAKTRHARSKIRQFARDRLTSWIRGVIPTNLLGK
jgi:GTP diphosphokinase / guanosine-3',5'-bis(diphosphate) 3'-diphosphatase